LKDLYASLPEEEQREFNEQLQKFLATERARQKSDLEAIRGMDNAN